MWVVSAGVEVTVHIAQFGATDIRRLGACAGVHDGQVTRLWTDIRLVSVCVGVHDG